jgi:hypothetical protein
MLCCRSLIDRVTDLQSRLEAAEKIAEEAERQLRVLSSHNETDGDRVSDLERQLKTAKVITIPIRFDSVSP